MTRPLTQQDLFKSYLEGGGTTGASQQDVATCLAELVASARAACPGVMLAPTTFAQLLGERAVGHTDPVKAFQSLYANDLYLAHACVLGEPTALRRLDEDLLARLYRELQRGGSLAGPLHAWLRLTLTRLALNLFNASARETSLDEDLMDDGSVAQDPELAWLRGQYRDVVLQSMRESLESLTNEERAILRMHFIDGLSAAEIGSLFQVSGRTVQRRILQTRVQIVERVKSILGRHVGLNASQVDTLMRLVQSDWNLSMHKLLEPN